MSGPDAAVVILAVTSDGRWEMVKHNSKDRPIDLPRRGYLKNDDSSDLLSGTWMESFRGGYHG